MSTVRARATRRLGRMLVLSGLCAALVASGLAAAPRVLQADGGDQAAQTAQAALTSAAPITSRLRKVAAGGEHSCGILNQELYCWGRNTWGQIGNGKRGGAVTQPQQIGNTGWRYVAAGGASTCGIRGKDRKLFCWGVNNRGQLGDGTKSWSDRPVKLGGRKWKSVDAGWYHTCGIKNSKNKLFCWGDNSHGQLGAGNTKQRLSKVRVPGQWRKVAVEGWTTCGIKRDNSLWCWGRNLLGQVGDGSTKDRNRPVRIHRPNWKSVDVSWTHGCAVRRNGSTKCWGNNDRGQLGDGTTGRRLKPTEVDRNVDAKWVSTSEGGTCLTTKSSDLYCWGDDNYGQVDGKRAAYARPQEMVGKYRYVSSGWLHSCGVRAGYGIDCWGNDERGQVRPAENRDVQPASLTTTSEPEVQTVAQTGAARKPLRFSLASFNVLGENHTGPYRHDDGFAPSRLRAEWTAQSFRTHGLDIIGTQEATGGQLSAILKAGNGRYDAFPHPTKDNKSVETSILWDTRQFEVVKKRVIWTQFIARKLPRPYIKFRHRESGRTFWVMNVHNAPWNYQKKRNEATRDQLKRIQWLESLGDPVYYVGDFNEWGHILCKTLRKTDMRSPLGGYLKGDGTCVKPKARMRVDWIFGSKYTDWQNFHNSKAPVIRLATDHWVPMVVVRVP
ncbi:hypothetical protein KUV85_09040 [Nocardioides panacisoli]|uniref:RCC1 domain-containing protein n=1 Tax=Nocardioides panacisoli TaxID=627624 RepID=UPI001C627AC6|nr:endonuclease/exonuclease/phosphatase family protein [Nocardioides panacisoli]QYJ02485.1 hypothetical protein KUV85_09040 [Nocardioides panacisoli]